MGVPIALLALLLCPVTPTTPVSPAVSPASPVSPVSPCFPALSADSTDVNLTGRISGCAVLEWGQFHGRRRLWLSHNGIGALSPRARLGPQLEELDLAYNRLRDLPRGFFANATALRTLRLEGNPLPAVPAAAFQHAVPVANLSVSCRCDVVGTVLAPCASAATHCLCFTSPRDSLSVAEFHGRECGVGAGLVGGVAGAGAVVAVLVAAGTAVACWRRRRAGAATDGAGWGKQDPAAGPRQPRYISRDGGTGTADGTDGTDGTDAPDYENIFVSPGTAPATAQGQAPGWQEPRYSPQIPEDEDYFLEGEADPGDQPIYANTLGPSEDIYIIPGQ